MVHATVQYAKPDWRGHAQLTDSEVDVPLAAGHDQHGGGLLQGEAVALRRRTRGVQSQTAVA